MADSDSYDGSTAKLLGDPPDSILYSSTTSVDCRIVGDDAERGDKLPNGAHCHTDLSARLPEIDKRARKKLVIASILCLLFTIGEAVGGVLAGSLAIATDSAHMLTDFASFMISLVAIYLASRPATTKLSFGWHRAEIIGALVSVQLIWLVTGILVYMAVQRVIHQDYEIKPIPMIITASCAVAVNIALGLTLHGVGGHGHSHFGGGHSHGVTPPTKPLIHDPEANTPASYGATGGHSHSHSDSHSDSHSHSHSHSHGDSECASSQSETTQHKEKENMNVRAALIHVIGDLIQSIGVLIAALIIYFKPSWKLADPICTFLFSVLVLLSTVNILRDAVRVLMEATPQHIEFAVVKEALVGVAGVKYVHNLRIWSLTTSKFTMSVHLAVEDVSKSQEILKEAAKLMLTRFDINESTIQIEEYSTEMDDCNHCRDPVCH